MSSLILTVVLMAAVTYIPRLLPMVFLSSLELPAPVKSFLKYIPYAALGALIFPGILDSTGSRLSALVGGSVSVLLAYFRLNVIIVVFGGIAGVVACSLILL
ncbi:MAG: AzlD domain-containing protein [Caulobacteraceae bacterium]